VEITKEELGLLIETAVKKALESHRCVFSDEERSTLKDVAMGGTAFKRIIIYLVVGFLLVGIGIKYIPEVAKAIK
jgi:hypothetical protein